MLHLLTPLTAMLKRGFIFYFFFCYLRASLGSTNRVILAPVLKLCLDSGSLWAAEGIHGYAIKIGLGWDVSVSGLLVTIYFKCGRIRDAKLLFDGMRERNVVLWNTMLKGYVQSGLEKKAFQFFSEFHHSGFRPDEFGVHLLRNGVSPVNWVEGKLCADQVQAYPTNYLCLMIIRMRFVGIRNCLSISWQAIIGVNRSRCEYEGIECRL